MVALLPQVLDNANSRMETESFLETLYGDKHVPCVSSLDCVKLTGLPYSATADDVARCLGELLLPTRRRLGLSCSGVHAPFPSWLPLC